MDAMTDNGMGWVVVSTGSNHYIGKVDADVVCGPPHAIRTHVRNTGGWLDLEYAFDFYTTPQMIRTPQGAGLLRQPMVMGLDFLLHECPVMLRVERIYFVEEMQTGDRETYKSFVAAAIHEMAEQRKKQSAERAGIQLADKMPNGGPVA